MTSVARRAPTARAATPAVRRARMARGGMRTARPTPEPVTRAPTATRSRRAPRGVRTRRAALPTTPRP
jgi:hypothetical protein